MKKIITLLVIVVAAFSSYSQDYLYEGNTCFESGDYKCAINNYNKVLKTAKGRDKQIAEIKLSRAKWCSTHLKAGNEAFASNNFEKAKEEYQKVINTNPKDKYAKSQKDECAKKLIPSLRKATTAEIVEIRNNRYGSGEQRRQNLIKAGIDPDDVIRRLKSSEGISLSVSKQHINFTAKKQTSDQIKVFSNADSYSVPYVGVPKWLSIETHNGYFTVTAEANPNYQKRKGSFFVKAGGKEVEVYVTQDGRSEPKSNTSKLSLSKTQINFLSNEQTSEIIEVYSGYKSYTIPSFYLPDWITINKYDTYFTVTAHANVTSKMRSDWFLVKSGSNEVKVYVSQNSGNNLHSKTSKIQLKPTYLRLSKNKINFASYSQTYGRIEVYTDANSYLIPPIYLPDWLSVEAHKGYFSITAKANPSYSDRYDWFLVKAGSMKVKVYVYQSGKSKYTSQSSSNKYKKKDDKVKRCFNCPKTHDTWGLIIGYTPQQFDYFSKDVVQFGIKIEPLFKYGFGMNTGINLYGYTNQIYDSQNHRLDLDFDSYVINVPLHLEYRLNFARAFNIFAYGGVGANVLTNSDFDASIYFGTLEYGGGLRINHIQFNVGRSLYLGNFDNIENFGTKPEIFQNYSFSISYMF